MSLTSFNRQQVANATQGATAEDLHKFAAAIASEQVRQEMARQQTFQKIAQRRNESAAANRERIEKVASVLAIKMVLDATPDFFGSNLQKVAEELPGHLKTAEEEMDAMAEELADGELSAAQLEDALIMLADENPELAAALIESETGQEFEPEEIDEAAMALADPEDGAKVASGLEQYPVTYTVLSRRLAALTYAAQQGQ